MIRNITTSLRRFRTCEDGSMVVPFALWAPVFIGLMVSSIELGSVTVRHSILERAVDQSVRSLKIGALPGDPVTLKSAICDKASILTNCMQNLQLEMIELNMLAWQEPPAKADCVETSTTVTPHRKFDHAGAHDVMLLRACYKFKPLTPLGTLGAGLPKDENGYTGLVSATAFVHEPD
ncbi:TadE/TadG family type IV pilus assembly protein [Thetidibacter halocola]|uniref:Pilus assembly protein n=1 Tax=Thetidibacter halocola TaxID=2827239 RepID=A0A8J7WEH6_9RHOB|nr:TadE family protein [Thetidibacter halocola]MBS0125307.1 pilus assembly protein [Thetidibacter halocola]